MIPLYVWFALVVLICTLLVLIVAVVEDRVERRTLAPLKRAVYYQAEMDWSNDPERRSELQVAIEHELLCLEPTRKEARAFFSTKEWS